MFRSNQLAFSFVAPMLRVIPVSVSLCALAAIGCGDSDSSVAEPSSGGSDVGPEQPPAPGIGEPSDAQPEATGGEPSDAELDSAGGSPGVEGEPQAPEPSAEGEPASQAEGDDTSEQPVDEGPICVSSRRLGTFKLYLGGDKTILSGSVLTGVNPRGNAELLAEEGGCLLLGPRSLFCETPCASGETCAGDNTCIPTPEKVSAGSLRVSGLAQDLEVEPNGITYDYSSNITEPYPGFAAGSEIRVEFAGSDSIDAFELSAWGVSAFQTEMTRVEVNTGAAVQLSWDASDVVAEQSEMYLSFTVNAHGSTTGWIECVAPDDGEFEIPAALVSQLVSMGLSGFPRVAIGRRSTGATSTSGGCVDLRVSSEVTLELEVDGLVSCNNNDQCPEGQTCSAELACEGGSAAPSENGESAGAE